MKTRLAAFLVLPAALLAVGAARAADAPAGEPTSASAAGLSPLARKYAVKREALYREFAAKRKALIDSPDWNAFSAEQKKSVLDALIVAVKGRDARLTADYEAERRDRSPFRSADAAAEDQARARRMDELQSQAAQEALRGRKGP